MLGAKKVILICGALVLCSASAVGTYLLLDNLDAIELQDPVKLTFSLESEIKEYDGEALVPDSYSLEGELLEGHQAVLYYIGSQVNVGSSTSDATVKIVNGDGVDVTSNYEIAVVPSFLEVTKKNLSIEFLDQILEYTGENLSACEYEIVEGELVQGHKIIPNVTGGQVDIGVIHDLEFNPKIYDALNNDVTDNYDLSYQKGDIEIVPKEIAIELKSYSKTYDGTKFTPEAYVSEGSLVYSHKLKVEFEEELINAFEKETKVLKATIVDRYGNDVTANYEIVGTEVDVEIAKKNLNIQLPKLEKVYDGKSFEEDLKDFIQIADIPKDLTLTYSSDLDVSDATKETIILSDKNFNISGDTVDNYEIKFVNGSLKINKANIEIIATQKEEIKYEKDIVHSIDNVMLIETTSNVESDEIKVVLKLKDEDKKLSLPGEYELAIDKIIINGEEIDIENSNYNIKEKLNKVNISKIVKTISLPTLEIEYGMDVIDYAAKVSTYVTNQLTGLGLEANITVDETRLPKEAGVHNLTGDLIVIDEDNDYFDFTFANGSVTINPKEVKIGLPKVSKVYGDLDNTNLFVEVKQLSTEDISIELLDSLSLITTAGKQVLDASSLKIECKDVNESLSNFNIIIEEGYYEITPKAVVMEPVLEKENIAYGESVSVIDYNLDVPLVNGEYISRYSLLFYNENGEKVDYVTDVGTYIVKIDADNLLVNGSECNNYHVVSEGVSVVVSPKEITVSVKSGNKNEKIYDGKPLSINPSTIDIFGKGSLETGLLNGHYLSEVKLNGSYVITDNTTKNTPIGGLVILDEKGNDVTNNYKLTSIPTLGQLKVNVLPRPLEIVVPPIQIAFSDDLSLNHIETIIKNSISVSSNTPLITGDYFNSNEGDLYIDYGAINLTPGIYEVEVRIDDIYNNEGKSVVDFYDVYSATCIVIIEKVNVSVVLPTLTKVYDNQPFGSELEDAINALSLYDCDIYLDTNLDYFTDAGTRVLTGEDIYVSNDEKYNFTFSPGTLTIEKKELVIDMPVIEREYNKYDFHDDVVILVEGKSVEGCQIVLNSSYYYSDHGTYTITEDDLYLYVDDNYKVTINPGALVIHKKKLTIELPTIEKEYIDSGYDFDNDVRIQVENKSIEGCTIIYNGMMYQTDVGTYPIPESYVQYVLDDNYEVEKTVPGLLIINKKKVMLPSILITKTYDDYDYLIDVMDEVESISNSEYQIEYIGVNSSLINAGTYPIRVKVTSLNNNIDYYMETDGQLIIEKKKIMLPSPLITKTYDDYDYLLDVIYEVESISNSEYQIEYIGVNSSLMNAGTYPIRVKVTSLNNNIDYYMEKEGQLIINKKKVEINLPRIERTYSGYSFNDDVASIINSMYVEGCNITYIGNLYNADVNTYDILENHISLNVSSNYEVKVNSGYLKINPQRRIINLPNIIKNYNGLDYLSEVEYSINSLSTGEYEVRYIREYSELFDAGIYAINANVISYSNNYEYIVIPGTLTINKIQVKVYLPTITKTYEDIDYTNQVRMEVESLSNSNYSIWYNLPQDELREVGTYTINATISSSSYNYEYILVPGTLTIVPQQIVIYLPNLTKSISDTSKSLNDEVQNFVNSYAELNDITLMTNLDSLVVGTYTLSMADFDVTNTNNVKVHFVNSTITITD